VDSSGCSDRLRSDGRARSAANIPLAAGGVKPVALTVTSLPGRGPFGRVHQRDANHPPHHDHRWRHDRPPFTREPVSGRAGRQPANCTDRDLRLHAARHARPQHGRDSRARHQLSLGHWERRAEPGWVRGGIQGSVHQPNELRDLGSRARSGASHLLLQVPQSAYNRAGLDPIRWSIRGILVSPGVWDCARFKLLNLDSQSGNLTPVTDARV
jgi:hypothetical protein